MYNILDITHLDYDKAISRFKETLESEEHISWRIDFGADHAQSKIIRDIVGSIFEYFNLVAPWKGRFTLVTDELINNAIEHGSSRGDLNYCIIDIHQDTVIFHISIEIHDTGNGDGVKSPEELKEIRTERIKQNVNDIGHRGRGLFFITEKIVDRLTFDSSPLGGIKVRIEKMIPRINQ